jgi:hypothetical protein
MAKVKINSDGSITFKCPGCNDTHTINNSPNHRWAFNGNIDKPTFSPSVLVKCGHYVDGQKDGHCWCTYNEEHPDNPAPFKCYRCHSFVRDGKIQFLNDCTHDEAGQTLDLEDID